MMGTERTRSLPRLTSAIDPAATTPLRRVSRCSESHGSEIRVLAPENPRSVVSTTEVADSSSKVETIWLPAVLATPRVATRAAMPSTAPRAVSSERPGRANSPASDSEARSRARNRERGMWLVSSGPAPRRSSRSPRSPRPAVMPESPG